MNYEEAIKYIHSTPKFSRVLGNDVLRKLLNLLGNPQKYLRFIHIGGTNGKGSVCAVTSSILKEAGYKVGMFTSPYIERFNERIQINSAQIPDNALAEIITEIKDTMEESGFFVSEFALITAAAFIWFNREKCDFVVSEVGMGGLLDATNVIDDSIVSVITSVSLDHTQYLGDTVEKIAEEKCGIIKENGTVVTYPVQNSSALSVIKNHCREKTAELIIPEMPEKTQKGFVYKGNDFEFPLIASYQPYNAVMALEAVGVIKSKGFCIPDSAIRDGVKNVSWMARCEKMMDNPTVIIDGAHNPDGVEGLCDTLRSMNKKIYIITAMMQDKDVEECIKKISQIADRFYTTSIDYPRCAEKEELVKYSLCNNTSSYDNFNIAFKKALIEADSDTVICICGSLYLAGIARKAIKENNF